MNLNTYQKSAMEYSHAGHDRIRYGCLGLIGESGEVVDVIKKHLFRGEKAQTYPGDDLIEELGDVMWYCAELATGLGMELEEALDIGYKSATRDGEDAENLEKAGVRLVEVCVNCYTYGLRCGDRRNIRQCLKKIYAIVRRIAHIGGIPISVILETNIAKQKKRYPKGYTMRR